MPALMTYTMAFGEDLGKKPTHLCEENVRKIFRELSLPGDFLNECVPKGGNAIRIPFRITVASGRMRTGWTKALFYICR